MENFTVYVEEDPRSGNFWIKYRDGKTRDTKGRLKKFHYKTIQRDQRLLVEGEWKTGKWIAKKLAKEFYDAHILGKLNVAHCNQTLEQTMEEYLEFKRSRGKAYKTVERYEMSLKALLKVIPTLNDLTEDNLWKWKKDMSEEGLSPHTIFGRLGDVRTFCKWLFKNKKISQSPFVDEDGDSLGIVGAKPEKKPRFWPLQEFLQFDEIAGRVCKHTQRGCRLAYYYGLRRVELVGDEHDHKGISVCWEDFLYGPNAEVDLVIRPECTKGKKYGRVVPIDDPSLLGKPGTGPIVPLTMEQFIYRFELIRELCFEIELKAGVKKKRTIHGYRHSLGKDFVQLGGGDLRVLQEILGHRDIRVTAETYSHFEQSYKAASMAKVGEARRKAIAALAGQKCDIFPKNYDLSCSIVASDSQSPDTVANTISAGFELSPSENNENSPS